MNIHEKMFSPFRVKIQRQFGRDISVGLSICRVEYSVVIAGEMVINDL